MAEVQLFYRRMERAHPVLVSLIECCESPIANFEWDVRIKKELPEGFTEAQAEAQRVELKSAYASIDNLREAITHLAHADFPGYSHIQKHRADGQVVHLECLQPYCFAKDGWFGDWFWNPDSKNTDSPAATLGEDNRIGGVKLPRTDFIIREVPRPINETAAPLYVRRSLIEKNWTAHGELFGLPSGILTMPENIPADKRDEYEAQAKNIAEAGTGAVPFGSEWKPNALAHDGTAIFKNHIEQLDADLVMVGTGGKLKMLVEKGAGDKRGSSTNQDDTFLEIAEARGNRISECFQRDFDIPFLEEKFPTQPALVEFALVTKDDIDAGAVIANVGVLNAAGFKVDRAWLQEQTGYVLDEAAMDEAKVAADAAKKAAEIDPEETQLTNRLSATLAPVANRLAKIRNVKDAEMQREMVENLLSDSPAILEAMKECLIVNGDVPGHEFHGNQYVGVSAATANEHLLKSQDKTIPKDKRIAHGLSYHAFTDHKNLSYHDRRAAHRKAADYHFEAGGKGDKDFASHENELHKMFDAKEKMEAAHA